MDMEFQTQFEFDLPKGYADSGGVIHKHGVMRLATAADEILPLRDPRVVQNPGYLSIILLGRVVTSLGTLPRIDNRVIEGLFSADLAFLQNMYETVNALEPAETACTCPECGHSFTQPVNFITAE